MAATRRRSCSSGVRSSLAVAAVVQIRCAVQGRERAFCEQWAALVCRLVVLDRADSASPFLFPWLRSAVGVAGDLHVCARRRFDTPCWALIPETRRCYPWRVALPLPRADTRRRPAVCAVEGEASRSYRAPYKSTPADFSGICLDDTLVSDCSREALSGRCRYLFLRVSVFSFVVFCFSSLSHPGHACVAIVSGA